MGCDCNKKKHKRQKAFNNTYLNSKNVILPPNYSNNNNLFKDNNNDNDNDNDNDNNNELKSENIKFVEFKIKNNDDKNKEEEIIKLKEEN